MKKLTILFCLVVTSWVSAQNTEVQSPWTYGVKGGVNLATLSGSYVDVEWVDSIDGIVGFQLGGWVNYYLTDQFSLQAELLGSIQGANVNYTQIPNPITGEMLNPTGEMRLPYITLPILAHYSPIDKLYLEGGMQLNYLPKVNIKAILNGEEVEDEQAADLLTNRLKNASNFDFGLNLGAGYEVIEDWSLYTRYTIGLITVDDREENQRDLNNRVLVIGVAYEF